MSPESCLRIYDSECRNCWQKKLNNETLRCLLKSLFSKDACSAENSSFTASFTDMGLMECKWLAHDGQQPD